MTRKPQGPATALDEVSKAIIAQLQQDGRRSYAAIGKVVGLSEAAVRQRVQRLVESGVMQVVAVTDPTELGFARQAMVGIRVSGPLEPVADAIAELDEVDYVVVTAGAYDLLVEVVAESDEHLLSIISGHIRAIPAVTSTETFMYLHLRKQTYAWGALSAVATAPDSLPVSLWRDTSGDDWAARPSLPGPLDVDVIIVGAGYTGLWSAYYLAEAEPSMRIAVLEAEVAGFGASGRNGGWCSALFPASLSTLSAHGGRDAALAQHRAMRHSIDEVARVAGAEGVDAQIAKGGTIVLARSRAQWTRARAEVAAARGWGRDEDELQLLDPAGARAVLRGTDVRGATYTPDCAALHPGRLVRGLAAAVERRGVRLFEGTPVTRIAPGRVSTQVGEVRAPVVIRATEGWTARLPGHARAVAPVYSLVIATEPLPPSLWDEIGLARRETFSDHRHLVVYGQRTADDRLVFGGRGAPYHLGSRIAPAFDQDPRVFARLWLTLLELLPMLHGRRVTHAWGGALGIPRDWHASVGLDPTTGLAWAGGYVGDGVSTANLAGRTLRDLVLQRDTELATLPWVGHRSPLWEPEPLRWLGINTGLRAMTLADAEESITGRPSRVAALVAPLLG